MRYAIVENGAITCVLRGSAPQGCVQIPGGTYVSIGWLWDGNTFTEPPPPDPEPPVELAAGDLTDATATGVALVTAADAAAGRATLGCAASAHDHDADYEPKNANLQAHVAAAHAPSDAQKNSDITKAEIEAKLTGQIASHTHAGGGAGQLCVPLVADAANFVLTNMALALAFLGTSNRFATKVDLTSYTQVRLVVNKQGVAGAAAAKIILRYRTAFDATPANWLDIGTSEVSCAINVQNAVLASAWIDLATLAKADVFICPLHSGGDGALDPVVGNIVAQFK